MEVRWFQRLPSTLATEGVEGAPPVIIDIEAGYVVIREVCVSMGVVTTPSILA